MTRHLLEHVIEERDSRCDSHRRCAIEIDCDLDRGLARPAVDPGRAGGLTSRRATEGPGFLVAALATDAQPDEPQVRSELQVRVAIADHVSAYDRSSAPPGNHAVTPIRGLRQSQPSAAWCGQKNSASKRIPWDSSSARRKSCGLAKAGSGNDGVPSPSWLLTSTKPKPASRSSMRAGYHARHQLELRQAVDLLVVGFLDQCAVAVDEQDALAVHASSSAASSRSFCSGVPTVSRRQPGSRGSRSGPGSEARRRSRRRAPPAAPRTPPAGSWHPRAGSCARRAAPPAVAHALALARRVSMRACAWRRCGSAVRRSTASTDEAGRAYGGRMRLSRPTIASEASSAPQRAPASA